jgi:hypothetical protein
MGPLKVGVGKCVWLMDRILRVESKSIDKIMKTVSQVPKEREAG